MTNFRFGVSYHGYLIVLPYGQVPLRLDDTSFPYADGLNRELGLGFPMAKISQSTTNSDTFSLSGVSV